ncbi:hypothetical protein Tco_1180014, partial [Tanacetum coccineum]
IEKGCQVYLAQVTSKKAEDKSEERRLEDVPIVREFPEVFPEDLPGLLIRSGCHQKDRKPSQNDKTEHGMEKTTSSPDAITTSSSIEEPKDSLIMEDEDINTISEKESGEENESSVENLFHIPSESKVTSDNESECDLQIFDDAPLDIFEDNCVIFSKPLFDSYGDTTSSEYSSDDESILEEDVFSNLPFKFDVESISSDVYPIYDEVLEDTDSTNYLIDSIIDFSPKIDPLLEEFAGELALIN